MEDTHIRDGREENEEEEDVFVHGEFLVASDGDVDDDIVVANLKYTITARRLPFPCTSSPFLKSCS